MAERGPVTRAEAAEAEARRLTAALERIASLPESALAYAAVRIARDAVRR